MTNLAHDLSTEAMLARIATIGGSQLFQEMVEANDEVKSFRLSEGDKKSQKVMAALEKARKATDEAYDNLCEAIEGGAAFADDPTPYEAFITEWNGTIKLYQDEIDRKGGKGGGKANGNGNENENPGGNGNQGGNAGANENGNGNQDLGGGDNTGGGQNTEDPENPTEPTNPTDPTNPTELTNPTEPGNGGGGNDDPDNGME